MKFIDEVRIAVQSGKGGAGCVSFRREKYIPKGGPDGGDGGRGGDVVLKTTTKKRTLYHLRFQQLYKAKNGAGGQGQNRFGKGGDDLIIELPPGTLVINADTGELIKDLVDPDEVFVVAKGGRGGLGNARFKSSTNRTPRFAQPGEPGETLALRLELKLLADVGIVGLPNAGKSTLVSALSSARPKIADYPFTTLTPNLGVIQTGYREPFIVADIPGLIEGAHTGLGLGVRFLRHVERTRVLLHLVDVAAIDPDQPLRDLETVNRELKQYSRALTDKPQVVVLNKMDVAWADDAAALFEEAYGKGSLLRISAAAGSGLDQLTETLCELLDQLDDAQPEADG
ncbi:GTPase ObgE [Desulfosarcina ovata]|uniref:GTPase Obg n=2 Tax=Desulfosarcina ovata TaxID=83564 RepID=A0A5K8AEY0_9BACT|nr:GTPase ObgE [Desulfosarcina ovata]BBO84618.1 GTPase Obg [Desulfosarcina ovata subsp. sediminis]BBO91099.1 GTPase Obg [Desulfosarcina ovata subsp. ovata]